MSENAGRIESALSEPCLRAHFAAQHFHFAHSSQSCRCLLAARVNFAGTCMAPALHQNCAEPCACIPSGVLSFQDSAALLEAFANLIEVKLHSVIAMSNVAMFILLVRQVTAASCPQMKTWPELQSGNGKQQNGNHARRILSSSVYLE